jgi:hypothetical protein
MKTLKERLIVAKRERICIALGLPPQDEVTHPVSVFGKQFTILMEEKVA